MRPRYCHWLALLAGALMFLEAGAIFAADADSSKTTTTLPIRGLHAGAPRKRDLPAALTFIRETLPREGVNTLILEFDYQFNFQSHPEFAEPGALGKEEVGRIAAACREKGITLIPLLNCLGHQSWDKQNGALLAKHPEFDETPGKFPNNQGIYCRSYCPLHPGLHPLLFDLIDELADACQARAVHVGMDEVFILGDPDCPRCKGQNPADLFAGEVRRLHDHLQSKGLRMWMWGDRFIDGKATGIGKWEASEVGTHPAIDRVPKDIVICDWHYEKVRETPRFFAQKGFDVVACPWRKPEVALGELALVHDVRGGPDKAAAGHAVGMLQTVWGGLTPFIQAYPTRDQEPPANRKAATEEARCFHALFTALATSSTAARPAVEIHQTSITQAAIDIWKRYKDINYPEVSEADYVSDYLWNKLSLEIFKAEIKARNFAPDPAYVRMKIAENMTSMTEEQYGDMKKSEKVLNALHTEFAGSKSDVDAFVKKVWADRGPELVRLNIFGDPKWLRTYLLLLKADADANVAGMIGSRPDSLPPTREEFLKQVNNTSNNRSFFEFMSQMEQVKTAVAGKVACSPEELARGAKYFEKDKAIFEKRESYSNGGLSGLLQELKKENLVDRWLMGKVKQDARFHDPVLERAFLEWEAKARPRHREVFGPF